MIFCLSILVFMLGSFAVQEFIPFFEWAYGSRLLLVHAVFYAASVSVPFPVMLLLAFVAGFLWDCRYHFPVHAMTEAGPSAHEIPFGFSILVFGLLGIFIQGVRPFFQVGRWELPVVMVGVCTLLGLLMEYFMISFSRGSFAVANGFWLFLFMTSLFSILLAPFLLLLFSRLARLTGFKIQMEGITRRYTSDHADYL